MPPINREKTLYFTAGLGCAILGLFLALLIISIALAERIENRGSGRDKLQNFLAAQTRMNPPRSPEKGEGRRD